MGIEDDMIENARLKMKGRMILGIVALGVTGLASIVYMFEYRPDPPVPPYHEQKPVMSAEDCTKMCGSIGVQQYNATACACNPPKKPGIVQVDRMDCNCACKPLNLRATSDSNDLKPKEE